jgi:hypothetical protein
VAEDERVAGGLPPNAVVVRGGQMEPVTTVKALRKERRERGRYALSVYSIHGLDAHRIALRVGTPDLPHPEMRESTAGRIREAGYEIALSQEEGYAEGHCDLVVPWESSEDASEEWLLNHSERLLELFDKKSPNPVKRPKGQKQGR